MLTNPDTIMQSNLLKKIFVLSLMVLAAYGIQAQTTSISGTVNDEDGSPLAGVNVIVKGKVIGTITDFEGNFSFEVSSAPPFIIQVSFIGFATQEIEITEEVVSGLAITLQEQAIIGEHLHCHQAFSVIRHYISCPNITNKAFIPKVY